MGSQIDAKIFLNSYPDSENITTQFTAAGALDLAQNLSRDSRAMANDGPGVNSPSGAFRKAKYRDFAARFEALAETLHVSPQTLPEQSSQKLNASVPDSEIVQ